MNATVVMILALAVGTYAFRLVGPVLVPSGSVVGPDVPRTDQRKALGVTLRQASWFFWIDDEPAALFAHPVRYATLGAAVATPGAASFKVIGGADHFFAGYEDEITSALAEMLARVDEQK